MRRGYTRYGYSSDRDDLDMANIESMFAQFKEPDGKLKTASRFDQINIFCRSSSQHRWKTMCLLNIDVDVRTLTLCLCRMFSMCNCDVQFLS